MLRRATAGLLMLLVTACTTFAPVAAPRDFVAAQRPSRLWVTRGDGAVVLMFAPRFVNDTLLGVTNGRLYQVPLSEVRQVQARRPSPRRTLLLLGASAVTLGVMVALVTASGDNNAPPDNDLGQLRGHP